MVFMYKKLKKKKTSTNCNNLFIEFIKKRKVTQKNLLRPISDIQASSVSKAFISERYATQRDNDRNPSQKFSYNKHRI